MMLTITLSISDNFDEWPLEDKTTLKVLPNGDDCLK